MYNIFNIYMQQANGNHVLQLVVISIIMDTVLGILAAARMHKANSSIGINGAIRKVCMILCVFFLILVDTVAPVNLIGFIPDAIRNFLPASMQAVHTTEFFGILFIIFEALSILKNMIRCDLPVKWVWELASRYLGKYTDEMQENFEEAMKETEQTHFEEREEKNE